MFTKADIEKYFMAEKSESLVFLVIGCIAMLLSFIFYFFLKTNFYKGAAIPLLVFGLIQAIVGYTVYVRSDDQRINNVYAYDMNPDKLKADELPRMKTVSKNFIMYRWIEIVLIFSGILLVFLFKANPDKSFWFGLGLALAIQAATMLLADYFAEQRASVYIKLLENFTQHNKTTG